MVHMPLILGFVVARITGMLSIKQTGMVISWSLALLLLLVTLLLASITYFGIEKPARNWLKKKMSESRWRWAN
jgi:peptidoglycan/LPS O-acetylase OafA/YrhL